MPARATKAKSTGRRRAAAKKSRSTKTVTREDSHRSSHGRRKWSAGVDTESTYPQEGLFKKDAATIARSLASKRVSPKGPASGLRMLNYFINRGGKGLTTTRRRTLERAKAIMMQRLHSKKTNHSSRSKRAG